MISHFLLSVSKKLWLLGIFAPFLCAQPTVQLSGDVSGLDKGMVFLGYIENAAHRIQEIGTGKQSPAHLVSGLKGNVKRIPLENGAFETTLTADSTDLLLVVFYEGEKQSVPSLMTLNEAKIHLNATVGEWEARINAFPVEITTSHQGNSIELAKIASADTTLTPDKAFLAKWEMVKHKENLWAMYGLDGATTHLSETQLDSLMATTPDGVFETAYRAIYTYQKPTQVGGILPEFTAIDPNGNTFQWSDFRGKYVLLEIWASWCVDCRKEHPDIERLYQKYKDKGFEVVGISNDDEPEWREALERDKQSWKQGYKAQMVHAEDQTVEQGEFQLSPLERRLSVQAFPTLILVDKEGKILYRGYEYVLPEIEAKLQQILSE